MKLLLCSIRDRLAGVYLSPFPSRSDVDAKRQIIASFDDPTMQQTPVAKNPGDFDLHMLGYFDDETGVLLATDSRILGNLGDLLYKPRSGTVSS